MFLPVFVCLSVCLSVSKITQKCMSTDVWTWMNLLTFEPHPDHSLNPGTGFLHFSGLSEEVMDGFH